MMTNRRLSGLLTVIALIGGSRCLAGDKASIAAPRDLRKRADQLCAAFKAKDARALYEIMGPAARRCHPFEEEQWERDFNAPGNGRFVSCRIAGVSPPEPNERGDGESDCREDPRKVESRAVVTLKMKLVLPDGSEDSIDDMMVFWERTESTWFWYDMGSPSMD